ncbi:MAG: hypothetical protein AAF511_06410, partial [Pseudomonadota bacterium]
MMSDGNDATIVFPHIPKTGGTTVFYHFRTQYDDEAVQVVGPFNAARRFVDGKQQFEELEDYSRIKVIQGHGVDEKSLFHIPDDRAKLFILLRHPVSLTRSRFNQLSIARTRRKGTAPKAEDILETSNLMCHRIVSLFPSFVKNPNKPLNEQAIDVLECFDLVLRTETMNEQLGPILDWLGVSRDVERRRVAADKAYLDLSDGEILSANQEDLALYEACNKPSTFNRGYNNPLGFNKERRVETMRHLRQS